MYHCLRFKLLLILAAAIGIIVYRLAVYLSFSQLRDYLEDSKSSSTLFKYVTPQMATTFTASIISFTVINILNFLYRKVAKSMTDCGETVPLLQKNNTS